MFMRFLLKTLINGVLTVPLLMWLGGASFVVSLTTSVVLSIIAYLIGDLWLLPRSNNTTATLADAGLAFLYFWVAARAADWALSFVDLLVLAVAVGAVEFFIHRMMLNDREVRS